MLPRLRLGTPWALAIFSGPTSAICATEYERSVHPLQKIAGASRLRGYRADSEPVIWGDVIGTPEAEDPCEVLPELQRGQPWILVAFHTRFSALCAVRCEPTILPPQLAIVAKLLDIEAQLAVEQIMGQAPAIEAPSAGAVAAAHAGRLVRH